MCKIYKTKIYYIYQTTKMNKNKYKLPFKIKKLTQIIQIKNRIRILAKFLINFNFKFYLKIN